LAAGRGTKWERGGCAIPDSAALHPGYVSISFSRRQGNAVNDLLGQLHANEERFWVQVVFTRLVYGNAEKCLPWHFSARLGAVHARAGLHESSTSCSIHAGASCPGRQAPNKSALPYDTQLIVFVGIGITDYLVQLAPLQGGFIAGVFGANDKVMLNHGLQST
jgi:hypothetical protein